MEKDPPDATSTQSVEGKTKPAFRVGVTPDGALPREQVEVHGRAQATDYAQSEYISRAHLKVLEELQGLRNRNLQGANGPERLRNLLLNWASDATPFSLIRLGDGEGNTMFWHQRRNAYPELAELSMRKILTLMFGRLLPGQPTWDAFAEQVVRAIERATIVGFPTPGQFEGARSKLIDAGTAATTQPAKLDMRGLTGVLATWDLLASLQDDWWSNPVRHVVRWHVHHSLLDMVPAVIRAAGNVSVITCYPELLKKLVESAGAHAGETLLIPPQAANIKGGVNERHYPDAFEHIVARLANRSLHGKLFLVGAGLLGKVYCDLIREQGGMSIDVGSMMDVWLGLSVRPNHDAVFLARHQL